MELPIPSRAVTALASYVRGRLAELPGAVAPLLRGRPDGVEIVAALRDAADVSVTGAARQFATLVVGASAPFASTSYARARLIRQMHAGGLLTADEAYRVSTALDLYGDTVTDADTPAGPPR